MYLGPGIETTPSLTRELAEIARDVRRIGSGWRADPEAIVVAREDAAARLLALAAAIARANGARAG